MIGAWKLFLLLIFCLILVVHFAECSKRSSRRRHSVARQSRRRQSAAKQSRRRSSYVKQSRRRSSSVKHSRRRSSYVKQSRRRSRSAKQSRRRSSSIQHSRRRHRPGKPIRVDGGWTNWSQWSVCRGRCGQGVQERLRFCTNPRPMYGGRNCYGYAKETRKCSTRRYCPVNGGWTNWSQWSGCRGRCEQGVQDRRRLCTNPRPMYGGRNCIGYPIERRNCNTGRPCPVNGGWTNWSQWTVCRGRCGQGTQERRRFCTNPRPMYGGRNCIGYPTERRNCNTGRPCPVNGGWTNWSQWSVCRGRCGQGEQKRGRSCTNPRPMHGGRNCQGYAGEIRRCDTGRPCPQPPVDGGWTNWSQWSVCRGRCGQGEQDRQRSCTNPRPMNGGRDCQGYDREIRRCDTGRPCPQPPVDGRWSIWSSWTTCGGRCGLGTQNRFRSCNSPEPANGGNLCQGPSRENRSCDTGQPCPQPPVDGGWTIWSQWSVCRGRCGQGEQERNRSCTNPRPINGGRDCYGLVKERRKCDTGRPCPQPPPVGGWTIWSQWSVCRGRCGQGEQNRRRSCTDVSVCRGYAEETRKCDTGRVCPANPCNAMNCKADQVCQVIKGRAMCIGLCPQQCPKTQNPVCGTDGRTYGNECMLNLVACTSNRSLKVSYVGVCWIKYEKHYG